MESSEPLIINTKAEGIRFYHQTVPTLQASMYKEPLLVLVTQKSTNMPTKSIKNTLEGKTMETQQKLIQKNYQTLTSWSEDFRARLSVLLANEVDLTTSEGHSFLTSQGFCQKKDPDIWYSKMLKVYLVMTAAKLSRQSLGFLPTWGIEWNGKYLTAKTSEFPKTESGCSLSDILEENVDPKYFLSLEQTERILSSGLSERAVPVQQLKNTLETLSSSINQNTPTIESTQMGG